MVHYPKFKMGIRVFKSCRPEGKGRRNGPTTIAGCAVHGAKAWIIVNGPKKHWSPRSAYMTISGKR